MEKNGNQISYSTTVYLDKLSLGLKGSMILIFFKNVLILKEYYLFWMLTHNKFSVIFMKSTDSLVFFFGVFLIFFLFVCFAFFLFMKEKNDAS